MEMDGGPAATATMKTGGPKKSLNDFGDMGNLLSKIENKMEK